MRFKDVYTYPEMVKGEIEVGELFVKSNVVAVNIGKDLAEKWRNIMGGKMKHYSRLLEEAFSLTLFELLEEAKEAGYDGILGLKSVAPTVVDGGIELTLYANGFKRIKKDNV